MTFILATTHKKALSVDLLTGEAEREETVLVAESVCVWRASTMVKGCHVVKPRDCGN